jgi:DNA-binding CsgD family transcriptional regulator
MKTAALTKDALLLDKALKSLSNQAGFAIAFGGLATRDGAPLSAFIGTRRHTLDGLLIEPTEGLGGRALVERKPVAALQYGQSDAITHRYDRQILAEDIVSLIAVPVIVEGSVRALIYGGQHRETEFGNLATHKAVKVAEALAWEYSVHDEVERRLALIETQHHAAQNTDVLEDLRTLYAEIRELGRGVADPEIARRLDAIGGSIGNRGPVAPGPAALSPREIDVLVHVGLGKRNAQIALQLGLTESTVKSYLSSVMTKLDADSRYAAVIAARKLRIIP